MRTIEKARGKAEMEGETEEEEMDEEDDGEDEEEGDDDGDDKMDQDEAPQLIDHTQSKREPEVDEDGFTLVSNRRRR